MGRAFQPEGLHRKAFIIFGGTAGFLPDIDIPIALMGHNAWFRWHQLFTHSLIGLLFLPLLLALIPFKFASFRIRYGMSLCGWILHICLDLSARWPVPLLWPLTEKRWSFMMIKDDFSWIVDMLLIIGLAISLWDPMVKHGRRIANATLIFVAAWLILGLPT